MPRVLPLLFILLPTILFAQELPVTPPVLVPAFSANTPVLATAGDLSLAVWLDFRGFGDVYAARIDPSGKVLDPTGLRLFHGVAELAAAPAPNGDFLVALYGCAATRVIVVTRGGAVSAPKTIDRAQVCGGGVSMATNGETILVLTAYRRVTLLDGGGDVVAGPFTLPAPYIAGLVASDGRDYLLVASSGNNIVAIPVSRRGEIGAARFVPAATSAVSVAVASNGNGYLLAAARVPLDEIATQPLSSDGDPIGAAKTTALDGRPTLVRLVWNGERYVAAWTTQPAQPAAYTPDPALFAGRVAASGEILDRMPLGPIGYGGFDLAPLLGNVVIARSANGHLVASLLHESNLAAQSPPPSFSVTLTASAESSPSIAATNNGGVVVWRDIGAALWRAETLDAAGRPTGRVVDVGADDLMFSSGEASVAFNGNYVVVAWRYNGALLVRRFTAALDPLDAVPVTIAPGGVWSHALAAGGGVALLAWQTNEAGATSGAILGVGPPIPVALPQLVAPAAAWNGSEFLVAYAFPTGPPPTQGLFPDPPADVRAVRVAPTGALLDAAPRTIAKLNTAVDQISAVSNGDGFFVAWRPDLYLGGGPAVISGKAVAADGSTGASDPLQISEVGALEGPWLAPADGGYAVAWLTHPSSETRVVEWRVGGGTIQRLPPMTVSGSSAGAAIAAIDSRIVLAYPRVDEAGGGVARVFVNSATTSPERRRVSGR